MRLVLLALESGDLALQEIVLWLSGNCMIESVPIGTFLLQNGRLMHFIDNVYQILKTRHEVMHKDVRCDKGSSSSHESCENGPCIQSSPT